MTEKKVRVTLPDYLFQTLVTDQSDFYLSKNKLCNMIFSFFHEKALSVDSVYKSKFNRVIQFNLTIENITIYKDICFNTKIFNEAEYFRKMFYLYSDQPKYKRELLLFGKHSQMIKSSIQKRKKLKIWYKDEFRIIEPYFFAHSDGESRNFIFCWCYKNNEFRNYRLLNIKPIAIIEETFEKEDTDYVKNVKTNFDPFLSFGKMVKVRLTPRGVSLFNKIVTNRPKVLEDINPIFILECSLDKARLYFPQFLEEVEILEPLELREWFRDKYQLVAKQYNKVKYNIKNDEVIK